MSTMAMSAFEDRAESPKHCRGAKTRAGLATATAGYKTNASHKDQSWPPPPQAVLRSCVTWRASGRGSRGGGGAAEGDLIFAPSCEAMYGEGFATTISLVGPAAVGLEDRFRPTHFAGVAIIVAKLLNQCRPDVAMFGEKDYQQLKVVTRMARDLDFETEIHGVPTVRDADGLALSSRNIFLSAKERALAPSLYTALRRCARDINAGVPIETALDTARAAVAAAGFVTDYLEARHAETLCPIASRFEGPVRLLAAARLGKTRLIDNIAV